VPLGSDAKPEGLWQVPVCVRAGKAEGQRTCTLLEGSRGSLKLENARTCPSSIVPNDGASGYYYAGMPPEAMTRLLEDRKGTLSAPERLTLVAERRALARAGKLPYAALLALVPRLAADSSRHVVSAALGLVAHLADSGLIPEALYPSHARFIRNTF